MPTASNLPSHYVGIGASAGGLEAIEAFFKKMDPESGLAFIVVQHLSPDYKSMMAELLSKRTPMPVTQAEEGTLVEANHVYLIPPNQNMTIFHGKLQLREQRRQGGINLPVDIFFISLAEDQGDKAIAVILSGTGSDGSRGIRAVKERVGMVMVQNHESAAFDGMPRSAIATGLVDYILPPDSMPDQLLSYVKHPYAAKSELSDALLTDEDGLNRIFAVLREKTGTDFSYYKPSTIVRRIERRMTVNQLHELRDYARYMEASAKEIDSLYHDLLIGVTGFFRDAKAFDQLSTKYLPELFKLKANQEVRFWSAGCSSGEEAYSLAILSQEVMNELGVMVDVKIFATDVDREAIVRAGAGLFPESIAADVPPKLLSKYFYRRENGFQVSRATREMVVFAQHNLIKDPPFTNIDLVSCRNLLIYLQGVLQKRALELFNFALNPHGLLFLGASETTGEMSEYFESLHHKWKIYRSRGRKRLAALGQPSTKFEAKTRFGGNHIAPGAGVQHGRFLDDDRVLDRLLQGVTGTYLPFTVVVNEALELLHVIGDASEYLTFPAGKMRNEASRLIRKELAIPLSTGLQKVLKSGEEASYSNIHLRDPKGVRTVTMRIRPLPTRKGQETLLAVFIEPHVEAAVDAATERSYDVGAESEQRIQDLEQELQFTRENLQATVEELETSNEELQATNEELLASNEELQSTNEELQSVNEELYTVNAEYQGKIAELTEANNDLDNLFNNTRVATLFLDERLYIRRYTAELTRFMRIIDQDVGRPFSHLAHDLVDVDLKQVVVRVKERHQPVEQEVQDSDGTIYLMRAWPYRISPETYSGVLLTFVDICTTKAMQRRLERSEERNRLAQFAARIGNWDWNIETNALDWSDSVVDLFGCESGGAPPDLEGFLACVHPADREKVVAAVEASLDDPKRDYFIEHRVIRKDGSVRWMAETGRVHRDDKGRPVRMVGIVQDVSERKQAVDAAAHSDARLHSLFLSVPIGVGVVVGRIIEWTNAHLQRLTGYGAEELAGRNVRMLYPDPAEYEAAGRELFQRLREHGTGSVRTRWRHKDGRIIGVELTATPVDARDPEQGITFTAQETVAEPG